jgi:tRNA(Phe) wybutosine-synthesizing methylase Tyw3
MATLNSTEYQTWLGTLTNEQRSAVELAVGIVMDSLLMLEGRMAVSEAELKEMNEKIALMTKRIEKLERYLCFPTV